MNYCECDVPKLNPTDDEKHEHCGRPASIKHVGKWWCAEHYDDFIRITKGLPINIGVDWKPYEFEFEV